MVGAVNPAPSQRTRMSAALTVIGAVLLICGVIMALVGEVMRLSRGELHGLVSGGVVVAILGLACGLGALAVAAGPSRQRGRFWTPGHPGYPVSRVSRVSRASQVSQSRFLVSYPQARSEPSAYASPVYPESVYAEPVYAEPVYAEPGHAMPVHSGPEPVSMAHEEGGALPPVRGPFDAYDRFAAEQADPSVRG